MNILEDWLAIKDWKDMLKYIEKYEGKNAAMAQLLVWDIAEELLNEQCKLDGIPNE